MLRVLSCQKNNNGKTNHYAIYLFFFHLGFDFK